jgi:polar amino acid transport system ATP-binding protein
LKLRLRNLSKAFAQRSVLANLNAQFGPLRSLVLIGPSGGGKSTLLRILAGLEIPDSGGADLNDEPIPYEQGETTLLPYRRQIGVVFQAFNLFPHLTALENITLPLIKVHGVRPEQARQEAEETLTRFRLAEHAHKKPGALSGGQKQRVAIARAIAIRPRLLLLDEPTSALDPEMTAEVLDLIKELQTEGRDFILVTHEMGFARQVADEVAFLADGQIVEQGPAEPFFRSPKTTVCQDFLARVLKY